MKSKITFAVAFLLFTYNFSQAQGKLNRAKEDLSGSSSNSNSSSRSSWSDDADGNDGIGYFDSVFVEIAYQATLGILFGEMQPRYFFEYPYSDGLHGEYAFPGEDVPLKRSQLIISNTFFASGKEFYGNDLKLNFRFIPIFGVEASHLHFFEQDPKVELGVSSFMLNYYRVREQNVTAYWGVGITHVGNGVDDTGFAYQVGVDVYLNKPISLGASWKQSLINDSSIDEFKLLARYHMKRLSLHGGFHNYKLGSVSINAMGFGVDYRF
ncbi:hypothetical protein U8527_04940 [Kordia algicida OT-1]|uniref:Outer membrane protein beta-barrel domain-containing protein n=1 Tax=Kordia algicida OT-1 TaxID=391587 RepID=A9DMB3_9FLAO|nr:hypothetical protein [Kordia algicida]EDP97667.1 hypothetical protein KAOT1_20932 [Kordia algicida OT-1]